MVNIIFKKSILIFFVLLFQFFFYTPAISATTTDNNLQSLQEELDLMALNAPQKKDPEIARMDRIYDTSIFFLSPLVKLSLLTFLILLLGILYRKIKKKDNQLFKILLLFNFFLTLSLYFLIYFISGTYGPMAPI